MSVESMPGNIIIRRKKENDNVEKIQREITAGELAGLFEICKVEEEFKGQNEQAGKLYEAALFGIGQISDEGENKLEEIGRKPRSFSRKAEKIKIARENYIYRSDKIPDFGDSLKEEVTKKLTAFLPKIKPENVKFFSSIGIHQIDHIDGVDGWIEVTDNFGNTKFVTLDVTLNQGEGNTGAEMVVKYAPPHKWSGGKTEPEYFNKAVEFYALRIAERLKEKLENTVMG